MKQATIMLDGMPVPFAEGQTIMDAAMAADVFIPHLCHHPEFKPQGSCKLCTVKANGRYVSSCTMFAKDGMEVQNNTPDLNDKRRTLLQMLFVEGNHFCPSCEKSGNCMLQALAYELEMLTPHFDQFYPDRPLDASHPDMLLDFNRCILCELCVRASRDVDGKNVFARPRGACVSGWRHTRETPRICRADRQTALRRESHRPADGALGGAYGKSGGRR